jgi:hypothetical protein
MRQSGNSASSQHAGPGLHWQISQPLSSVANPCSQYSSQSTGSQHGPLWSMAAPAEFAMHVLP